MPTQNTPQLFTMNGKQYNYTDLAELVLPGLQEYSNQLRRHRKFGPQFEDDVKYLMNGLLDRSITYSNGQFHDSLGRRTNNPKDKRDTLGFAARYIYDKMQGLNPYEAEKPEEWTNKQVGKDFVQNMWGSDKINYENFWDLDPYDEETKARALTNRSQALGKGLEELASSYIQSDDKSKKGWADKIQEFLGTVGTTTDGQTTYNFSNDDLLGLGRILGDEYDWRRLLGTSQYADPEEQEAADVEAEAATEEVRRQQEAEYNSPEAVAARQKEEEERKKQKQLARIQSRYTGKERGLQDVTLSPYNWDELNSNLSNKQKRNNIDPKKFFDENELANWEQEIGDFVKHSYNINYPTDDQENPQYNSYNDAKEYFSKRWDSRFDSKWRPFGETQLTMDPYQRTYELLRAASESSQYKDRFIKMDDGSYYITNSSDMAGQGNSYGLVFNPSTGQISVRSGYDIPAMFQQWVDEDNNTQQYDADNNGELSENERLRAQLDGVYLNKKGGKVSEKVRRACQIARNGAVLKGQDGLTVPNIGVYSQHPSQLDQSPWTRVYMEPVSQDNTTQTGTMYTDYEDPVFGAFKMNLDRIRQAPYQNKGQQYLQRIYSDALKGITKNPLYYQSEEIVGGVPQVQVGMYEALTKPDSSDIDVGDTGLPKEHAWLQQMPWGDLSNTLMEAGRAMMAHAANKKIHDILSKSIRPHLITAPQKTAAPITGNFGVMQQYNQQAAEAMRQANRPMTSDASLQASMMLQGNKYADQLEQQGFLTDNAKIQRTKAEALQTQNENAHARNEAMNRNNFSINQARMQKAQLDASLAQKQYDNWDRLAQHTINQANQRIAEHEAIQDQTNKIGARNEYDSQLAAINSKFNPDGTKTDAELMSNPQYVQALRLANNIYQANLLGAQQGYFINNPYKDLRGKGFDYIQQQVKFKNGGIINPKIIKLINKVYESYS